MEKPVKVTDKAVLLYDRRVMQQYIRLIESLGGEVAIEAF